MSFLKHLFEKIVSFEPIPIRLFQLNPAFSLNVTNRYYAILILVILSIIAGTVISHLMGETAVKLYGNLAYLPVSALFVGVAFWSIRHFGIDGSHGIAWLSFAGFAMMWSVAGVIWIVYDLVLGTDPFPSPADLFYLMGYPFLFLSLVSYLIPFKEAISRSLVIIAVSLSVAYLILTALFQTVVSDGPGLGLEALESFEALFSVAYPVADGIILIPIILGIGLFLRDDNRVKPMWALIFLGVLSSLVGDLSFMLLETTGQYYTGHPVEILFLASYVLMAFGIYGYGKRKIMQKL